MSLSKVISGRFWTATLLAASVGGCSLLATPRDAASGSPAISQPTAQANEQSPVLLFVATGAVGQSASFSDPYFGNDVTALLEGEYSSASGQTCRRFVVTPTNKGPGQIYYACAVNGAWRMSGIY